VAGGRIVGWGPHRHAMSFGATMLSRLLLGLRTKDVTSGFRCYTVALATAILAKEVQSDGYAFQEETLFFAERSGARVVEVPITFRDRTEGRSKLGWRDIVQFFLVIRRLRRSV
jgi:dolichol-phosphate mannosyltransferase